MISTAPYLMHVPSPIGLLEVTADAENILSLTIARSGQLPFGSEPNRPSPLLDKASAQLKEYFDGTRTSFDLPIRFDSGTLFQKSVWTRLASLAFGQYISYAELGVEVGTPGSARAIGGAVGANPIPIIIGCHRVLASNGRLTGYSGGNGIETKVWLLAHEGIAHVA
ncbi:MAG: Cysteine methyltransferase [Cryobacterium sp.]|jgi:methylated-DNA-[protein]-cysteine S-methyltransferase|nr:Cysteine methyltransferase [Cryobacterium sp.]